MQDLSPTSLRKLLKISLNPKPYKRKPRRKERGTEREWKNITTRKEGEERKNQTTKQEKTERRRNEKKEEGEQRNNQTRKEGEEKNSSGPCKLHQLGLEEVLRKENMLKISKVGNSKTEISFLL
jgi:hypothetical protein